MQPVGATIARGALVIGVLGVQVWWVSSGHYEALTLVLVALGGGVLGSSAATAARRLKPGVRVELLVMAFVACGSAGAAWWVWSDALAQAAVCAEVGFFVAITLAIAGAAARRRRSSGRRTSGEPRGGRSEG